MSDNATFLGLDLGTSGLRGLLVNNDGYSIGDATASYSLSHPRSGWSEQDPDDWITACKDVFSTLRSKYGNAVSSLTGIGIAGHMHGATCVDENGVALRPCILWNDTRSAPQAERLDANPEFQEITGNIVFPGFTAPKVLWLAEHEAETHAKIGKVLLPKDYVVHWLTGVFATDASDAAGTAWLDMRRREWAPALLDASGLTPDHVPPVFNGCDVVGTVRKAVADELGVSPTTRVVAGAADNAAAACGLGVLGQDSPDGGGGGAFASLGTSGVLLTGRDGYAPCPGAAVHTFCHAVPGCWYQMGVTLAAARSIDWLASVFGRDVDAMTRNLPDIAEGPSGVLFLPYLSGERTPHNEPRPKGAFLGLSVTTDGKELVRSVMEGVAFSLRDCLEAIVGTGADVPAVVAIGGGSNSSFWLDSLANILRRPVHLPKKGDFGAALGAARLAMVGAGAKKIEDVMTPPPIARTFTPREELVDLYEKAYSGYKNAYPKIRDLT